MLGYISCPWELNESAHWSKKKEVKKNPGMFDKAKWLMEEGFSTYSTEIVLNFGQKQWLVITNSAHRSYRLTLLLTKCFEDEVWCYAMIDNTNTPLLYFYFHLYLWKLSGNKLFYALYIFSIVPTKSWIFEICKLLEYLVYDRLFYILHCFYKENLFIWNCRSSLALT